MKQFYLKSILTLCLFSISFLQAQTYNINTTNVSGSGGTCANSGIDSTFDCVADGAPAIDLGSFTDTNSSGVELSTMGLTIYGACSGDVEFFINGTSIYSGSATGLSCSCQSITSDPNLPQNYTVTVTPVIIAAYVIGGNNTLSVSTSNSAFGVQCFYGADVTVTTATLGNEDFDLNSLKVYPNPANDFITLSGLKKEENYRIFNVLGTEILKGTILDSGKIEIQNFQKGLYFLEFDNGYTIKIIKE
ncbi:MAG: T9SS type A sorting domain-containing protein [Flavobacterium sp.]|nr:T9SS type A sorting domain-containing protein [Flavobacterium sp.]